MQPVTTALRKEMITFAAYMLRNTPPSEKATPDFRNEFGASFAYYLGAKMGASVEWPPPE